MTKRVLPQTFFKRDAHIVAKELLGKFLVRKLNGKEIAEMINEVEIYEGFDDLASHARFGKTKRTTPMFEEGGIWYVYLCYGMYEMLNIVTGKKDHPSAILIRGAGPYDGPGKLTRAFSITRTLNGKEAAQATGLWIEDRGIKVSKKEIITSPRIGVKYAKEWVDAPLRFFLKKGQGYK